MILDCPACGAALVFDPETGKMKCESCSNLFETYELDENYIKKGEREINNVKARERNLMSDYRSSEPLSNNPDKKTEDKASNTTAKLTRQTSFDPEASFDNPIYDHASEDNETIDLNGSGNNMMECSIYTCTSCGAEIMVNDVEVSTFCSYCGQPTLVFSRMAETVRPEYILPFKVTKERAIALIKENFANGYFVPEDIKNVKMERVRGIYIPYWLYDIHYEDNQYLEGVVGSGKNSRIYYYFRKAECDFDKLALDASVKLDDRISRKLNPYHTGYMKEFSMEYLSGFYADLYDADTEKLKGQAILRAQSTFDNELKRSVSATSVRILKKFPSFQVTGTHYALFPAWFLTFINDGKPYTILVNGQTEKVVGGVPYDMNKVFRCIMILGFFLSVLIWCILYPYLLAQRVALSSPFLSMLILMIPFISKGKENFQKIKESRELTALSQTNQYVKDRQE